MRNLDGCRRWWCMLCPCKLRNKFFINIWNRTILLCIPCICWKPGMWSQQTAVAREQHGNNMWPSVFYALNAMPHSNRYAHNNRGRAGNGVVCGSMQRLYLWNCKKSVLESLESAVSWETYPLEVVIGIHPWWRHGWWRSHNCCESLCSNAELV
jgi:hypothetical protein